MKLTRLLLSGAGALMAAALAGADAVAPDAATPLVLAAHNNDLAAVQRLLAARADAKAANAYGVTALMEAAANGNAAIAERLLAAGADANAASLEGETPLMAAARAGDAAVVKMLLKHGATLDSKEAWKGQTALMWAAAANRGEAAAELVHAGADLNARSTVWTIKPRKNEGGNLVSNQPRGGLTPLLYAARQGSLATAKVLVEAGANLNLAEPDGISPLVMATINAHYDLAVYLLEAGADPNIADKWGRAALYAALDMQTLEPSVTRPAPKTSDTHSGLDVARLALMRGAKVDGTLAGPVPGRGVSDNADPILRAGATPFIRAAKTGDVDGMRLLLQHGADAKAATALQVTALMAAAGLGWRYGDSEISEEDGLEAVKICLELGLDPNMTDAKGRSALHGAAERGGNAIAEYLVAHGANLDLKDNTGLTPVDVAKGNGGRGNPEYPQTVALLTKLAAQSKP